jgi:hypothetical protein
LKGEQNNFKHFTGPTGIPTNVAIINKPLNPVLGYQAGEMPERPVVGGLGISRETAGGEFPVFQVILQAFAAGALLRTGLIGAVAVFLVLIQLTIHMNPLLFIFIPIYIRSRSGISNLRIFITDPLKNLPERYPHKKYIYHG